MTKDPDQLDFAFLPQLDAGTSSAEVVDLGMARRRLRPGVPARRDLPPPSPIDGRQALVLTLVEQLVGLVRGTTTPQRAGAVRRAASRALDVMERVDEGKAEIADAQRAFREVESLLSRQR